MFEFGHRFLFLLLLNISLLLLQLIQLSCIQIWHILGYLQVVEFYHKVKVTF